MYRDHPISIHALREEGDVQDFITARRSEDFYPRPPRGGRLKRLDGDTEKEKFLSTPSARRATLRSAHRSEKLFYFYPRPPRGGRLIDRSKCKTAAQISIHALREEGDLSVLSPISVVIHISIHALREEGDHYVLGSPVGQDISIHALREEGDGADGLNG